jgi:hypothetical protein
MARFRFLIPLVLAGCFATTAARAEAYCTPGALRACFSISFGVVRTSDRTWDVAVRVANLQGTVSGLDASAMWGFWWNTPPITSYGSPGWKATVGLSSVAGPAYGGSGDWVWGGGIVTGAAEGGGIYGCSTGVSGIEWGFRTCGSGQFVTFNFELGISEVPPTGPPDVGATFYQVAFYNADGTLSLYTLDELTVLPEPFTIVLLGSGLAAMGGVGAIRRRKKNL